MKKSLLTFGSLFLIAFSSFSQCVEADNVYAFTYNGRDYELIKENKTWADAAACAVLRGGTLARIDSAGENTALFNALTTFEVVPDETVAPDGGGGSYIWLAGTDKFEEGRWIWDGDNDDSGDQFWLGLADGTPIGGLYNNWGNEPDNSGGQDNLGMSVDGWPLGDAMEWNDIAFDNELYFFIEFPVDDTGIDDNSDGTSTVIYPNPVNDVLFVSLDLNSIKSAVIYDLAGNIILNQFNLSTSIDVSELDNGIYFIEFEMTNGNQICEKFIK